MINKKWSLWFQLKFTLSSPKFSPPQMSMWVSYWPRWLNQLLSMTKIPPAMTGVLQSEERQFVLSLTVFMNHIHKITDSAKELDIPQSKLQTQLLPWENTKLRIRSSLTLTQKLYRLWQLCAVDTFQSHVLIKNHKIKWFKSLKMFFFSIWCWSVFSILVF